ncbi:hypothetical protein Patl1_31095 [Pistacia atlantica]|uniref:Uncharacterized protein n=1 Tax=Pistacia atlantica TaxID=434234 RepID=A0ACC1AA52_9ROSI|nr:hypothetical protein Patl1_31095 [Pistacia atlantica]
MCSGSKRKPTQTCFIMDTDSHKQDGLCYNFSILLELTASDDLLGFKIAIEEEGHDIDEPGLWYGRRTGSRKMGACGSDGATALHCAASGGSSSSPEIVKLLLDASADIDSVDANGNRPADLIARGCLLGFHSRKKVLESLLRGDGGVVEIDVFVMEWLKKRGYKNSLRF